MSVRSTDMDGLLAELRPGMRIFLPGSSGEPTAFLDALKGRPEAGRGLQIVTNFLPGINRLEPDMLPPDAHVTGFFGQPRLGDRFTMLPLTYREIDDYLAGADIDLAIVQLSPPDAGGQCSLGPCVEFSHGLFRRGTPIAALINRHVPRDPSGPAIPFASLALAIEVDRPLLAIDDPGGDAVSEAIAVHVASLIADGATLQTGIGKIPGQILRALTRHRGLSIRSGILLPAARDLDAAGALSDAPMIAASVGGDRDFHDWAATSGRVRLTDVTETHDIAAMMAIPHFTAINSAIEVDLSGQCNAEMIGGRSISGPGGLPQFTVAARHAPYGRSIIALPSTDASGRVSRIVAALSPGALVSVPSHGVDFVVTEHGVADLRRADRRARALSLAGIAAPQFRSALIDATEQG
jgi:4-hydroxybutyrate CoA-transferase